MGVEVRWVCVSVGVGGGGGECGCEWMWVWVSVDVHMCVHQLTIGLVIYADTSSIALH